MEGIKKDFEINSNVNYRRGKKEYFSINLSLEKESYYPSEVMNIKCLLDALECQATIKSFKIKLLRVLELHLVHPKQAD